MILSFDGHSYRYECEKICRIFFPTEKIVFSDAPALSEDDPRAVRTIAKPTGANILFRCEAEIDGVYRSDGFYAARPEETDPAAFDAACEKLLAQPMLHVLSDITGVKPPWGVLTGVRPAKLMRRYIAQYGEAEAMRRFTGPLMVSKEKAALACRVALAENEIAATSADNSFSLYVSVPFCPTRCAYCSFVSHSVAQAKKLIPDYVRLLCKEIGQTADLARELGLRPETVYIGGGTPTSLSAEDLRVIADALNGSIDMKNVREFTVEAGRPDTVDREKLSVLKHAGVTRISINPQTFSDAVLERIGRRHTAAETIEKYQMARDMGFDDINMDLIAGLPGDTPEGFAATLDKAISLAPENITVHTLALKRSSELSTEDEASAAGRRDAAPYRASLTTYDLRHTTSEMLSYAAQALPAAGYAPYYLYRQSKSAGNLENVGWTKPGKACLYNVFMMEEIHSVLAVGGGAVTRLADPRGGRIERVYNFKYPYEYVGRFEEQSERKDAIRRFYE
ncbi:MAG: coproporphyrinogen dehydrogenase HemZ [Clostridia bacterium]|nr:coproporphyrinogen dehydrogenase HemZ [Clostridia bacterium]